MKNTDSSFTVNEVMAVALARLLRDDEMAFVGVGTGGRAFTLTFGIPVTAARLAQFFQAPGFALQLGSLVSPRLDALPTSATEHSITNIRYALYWPAASRLSALDNMDVFTKGGLDVGFASAAQIDRFGNTNITCIGDPDRPKSRLVGCLAHPELMAFPKRTFLILDQTPRTFVERVDYRTGVGYLTGGDSRERAGIPGGGPEAVITDKAVLDFEPESKVMRLRSCHPGVTVEQIRAATGFRLVEPKQIPETEPPTAKELELIRTRIDPHKVLLGHEAR
jgi:glutaconate CoA-transferase subunit B